MPYHINWNNIRNCLVQKDENRNLGSATFHMLAITLISMSLVDLTWFSIVSDICYPYLTLGEFFWYGYIRKAIDYSEHDCIDTTVVNMIRIIILLCFMAMLFSLIGFFLDITSPTTSIFVFFRKYSVAGTLSILFVMAIITMSYYVIVLLHNIIEDKNPSNNFDISYGLGFFLVALAGGIEALGLLYNLLLPYRSSYQDDDRLIDGFDDASSEFESPTPPPPYSLPPPPYTP